MQQLLLILMITMSYHQSTQASNSTNHLQTQLSYRVEWIGERPLMDYSYLNIVFDQDNKAYGLAGCNYWSANYQLEDNNLIFKQPILTTNKQCAPALMEQEQRFLKALPTIRTWDFSEVHQLQLWPAQGLPIKLWAEEDNK